MMKRNFEKNELGSIGIGAMIVFIALILVAAVASAVIIQTGEKLQQNAQQTGQDTERELGGKVTINGVVINTVSSMRIYFESAPGSGVLATENIAWSVSCSNNAQGGYNFLASAFEDGNDLDAAAIGDTYLATDPDTDAQTPGNRVLTIDPGVSYVIDVGKRIVPVAPSNIEVTPPAARAMSPVPFVATVILLLFEETIEFPFVSNAPVRLV